MRIIVNKLPVFCAISIICRRLLSGLYECLGRDKGL